MSAPLALSAKRIEARSRLQHASTRPSLVVYSALAEFCPARLNRHYSCCRLTCSSAAHIISLSDSCIAACTGVISSKARNLLSRTCSKRIPHCVRNGRMQVCRRGLLDWLRRALSPTFVPGKRRPCAVGLQSPRSTGPAICSCFGEIGTQRIVCSSAGPIDADDLLSSPRQEERNP